MFKPKDYEDYLDEVFDSYKQRLCDISSKENLSDEDIEELRTIVEYIEKDRKRRYTVWQLYTN